MGVIHADDQCTAEDGGMDCVEDKALRNTVDKLHDHIWYDSMYLDNRPANSEPLNWYIDHGMRYSKRKAGRKYQYHFSTLNGGYQPLVTTYLHEKAKQFDWYEYVYPSSGDVNSFYLHSHGFTFGVLIKSTMEEFDMFSIPG